MTKTRVIVISDEGLPIKSFGPYGNVQIQDGVVFMREGKLENLEQCYKIPDGYALEFVYE